jgi:peptide/nickel transport system ATP-binding protein
MRQVRGAGIAMIFQEPMTALNPLRTVGDQIGEMFRIHTDLSKARSRRASSACWRKVRIPDPRRRWAPIRMSCPAGSASAP